ncbi:PIG-L family deacetylase [Emticicia oligotrophica]|uniref:PIG-L family deacetylase n=1 Tax=Emticicia oligotrophica TaxID=312279 RepID=UPI00273C91AD|nr:PIG-L family deacetylase [Emticicia oligotrophica]
MKKITAILLTLISLSTFAQTKQMNTGEILQAIKRLNVVGNVLYVAAHPDDENTLFITWLSKEKMVRAGYIAMTRGDGGQNLIGSEQGEYVGLLRTHELLGARSVDGGEQYFTRANDFGFTKTTEEALATWGKEQVLADLVWRIRNFQPDVIVNRFPPDSRAGHGHHSASAVLSEEAFKAAADPTKFPEQLKYVKTWQAKRLVWNSFSPNFQNNQPEGSFVKIQLGDYNPLLGKSYSEIAAEARSMHKSQGFGSAKTKNQRVDYALHKAGEEAKNDLFEGIDLSWKRMKGGEKVEKLINEVYNNFKPQNPSTSIPKLIEVFNAISALEENVWTNYKKKEVQELILACAGLWFEANPTDYSVSPNDKIKVNVNVVSRSNSNIILEKLVFKGTNQDTTINKKLVYNDALNIAYELKIPANTPITQPYWLVERKENGFYKVTDQVLRGLPMKPADLTCEYTFSIEGKAFTFTTPLSYKYVEPSDGEIYRYFEVRPEVTATIAEKVYAFGDNSPKDVVVTLKAGKKGVSGSLTLEVPKDWRIEPASINFDLKDKYEEKKVSFKVYPSNTASEITLKAIAKTNNGVYDRGIATVEYKHIPTLTLFPFAEAKALRIDLQKRGNQIGYIAGAGDEVPAALQQIGYQVTMLTPTELAKDLSQFDAIIVGVRAYNTEEHLKFFQDKLIDYVKNGGNVVTQYQTNAFYGVSKVKEIGPYPFAIGRGRVTDEKAEMKVLKPTHPLLNTPNKITEKDFDGWIQERGLYFSDKWSDQYETIFSIKDANETEQEGSVLYAKYGKGNFVFTALAFFRELPAGVPGAYRLFANMISVGK